MASEPEDQIKVDPQVALVKDLITDDVEESSIHFCAVASNIATSKNNAAVSGVPVVSVKIGDHNYYGLCDMGDSLSVIPFSLYQEVMNEITPCEIKILM